MVAVHERRDIDYSRRVDAGGNGNDAPARSIAIQAFGNCFHRKGIPPIERRKNSCSSQA
jgi:hypothetical protein